jgi:hypothetical protein
MPSSAASDDVVSVFFAHSPITYSIALTTIALHDLSNVAIVGARGIAGPRIRLALADDGEWSPARTCATLREIIDLIPTGQRVDLYLPHTAFLLGKLVKFAGRVRHIHYIEEGYSSAFLPLLDHDIPPTAIDLAALGEALRQYGLIDALQLDEASLARLNQLPDNAFDAHCAKYAGAFACSTDAFAGLPLVTRVELTRNAAEVPARLLSFFGIRNYYGSKGQHSEKAEQACRLIIALARSMRDAPDVTQPLVVKLHPNDYSGLPAPLHTSLRELGVDYFDFCRTNGLDPNLEPALHNFSHYHIFGHTSQVKYVEQFCGPHRLTRYARFS